MNYRLGLKATLLAGLLWVGAAVGQAAGQNHSALPFSVSLAPGDVIIHGGSREVNSTDHYQRRDMQSGDQVVGQGGRLRSVILTGDSSAVEVLNGSSLVAHDSSQEPYLELANGRTRVGRASSGDRSRTHLQIRTQRVATVVHGDDLVIGREESGTPVVAIPESDHKFLGQVDAPAGKFGDVDTLTFSSAFHQVHPTPVVSQVVEPEKNEYAQRPVRVRRRRYARHRVHRSVPPTVMAAPVTTLSTPVIKTAPVVSVEPIRHRVASRQKNVRRVASHRVRRRVVRSSGSRVGAARHVPSPVKSAPGFRPPTIVVSVHRVSFNRETPKREDDGFMFSGSGMDATKSAA